jgi:hypothetical protein
MTDIALERRLLAAEGLEIRRREEYGAQLDYRSDRACDFRAKRLFLHIALVDDPSDLLGPEDQVARRLEEIGQQRFQAGWSYNAAAFNTGRLYEGQPLTRRGTHTVNTYEREECPAHGGSLVAPATSSGFNNNITDRALVLPQQLDDPVTDVQLDAAARWGAALRRSGLAAADARWHGHRCVTAKGCPGETAYQRIPELQELTDHYTRNGLTDMPLSKEDIAAVAAETTRQLLGANVAAEGPTVRAALRQSAKTRAELSGLAGRIADRVSELVVTEPGGTTVTVTADQLKEAVKQALREGTEDPGGQ